MSLRTEWYQIDIISLASYILALVSLYILALVSLIYWPWPIIYLVPYWAHLHHPGYPPAAPHPYHAGVRG